MKKNINDIKVGDVFELSDYHALQICNGTFQVEITHIDRYKLENLTITVMSFEYQGDTMALIAKSIENETDYFVTRIWEDGLYIDILRDMEVPEDTEDMPDSFMLDMDGVSEYSKVDPFPLFGFRSGYEHFGIGEYVLQDEHDETYWAISAFWIWNISPDDDEDDMENYSTLAFGWPVTSAEIEFIRGK
jgi:hypothetical protein